MLNEYLSKVSIRSVIGDRSFEEVLDNTFQDLGNVDYYLNEPKTIFLKIDLQHTNISNQAISLYDSFLFSLCDRLLKLGVKIQLGDASILPVNIKHRIKPLLKKTSGIDNKNLEFIDLEKSGSQQIGLNSNTYYISKPVLNADIVINVPFITTDNNKWSSLYNLTGVLPGYYQHVLITNRKSNKQIASICVDLFSIVNPKLSFVLYADEKNSINYIISSPDLIAVEYVLGSFIKRDQISSLIIEEASNAGLGIGAKEGIKILGDLNQLSQKQLDSHVNFRIFKIIKDSFSSRLSNYSKVWINREFCDNCLNCTNVCPTGAIRYSTINSKVPILKELCINCYCCHANCPKYAIVVENNYLNKQISQ